MRQYWKIGALLFLAGCAGTPPTDSLSKAEVAINRAIEEGAADHAPLELRMARDKLDVAKKAMNDSDYDVARRLAEEAAVDANVAIAKAKSDEARQEAEKLRQTIEDLRQESLRRMGR
jgi:hypothetical protein